MRYYGWWITYGANGAMLWRASKHGVSICARDKDALVRMLDQRRSDGKAGLVCTY